MTDRFRFPGTTALVTGAGSGIGRAVSCALAERGCHLALVDVDAAGLAETASRIGPGVRVSRHRIDLADTSAVTALPDAVAAVHDGLSILVNNAGVALGGTFDTVSAADFDWLFAINFGAVVAMTRAFLPMLERAPQGQIVMVSSVFGLVAPPGQAAYAASKYAVRGFADALRHELAAARSPVAVTTVHPGGVRTAIADNARVAAGVDPAAQAAERARFARALRLPPERAAQLIVRAIERRRPRLLVGTDARIVALIERLMPVGYWRLLGRLR